MYLVVKENLLNETSRINSYIEILLINHVGMYVTEVNIWWLLFFDQLYNKIYSQRIKRTLI